MDTEADRNRVLEIYKAQDELAKELKKLIKKLQASCIHQSVIETDYLPSAFFADQPPRRICVFCGLEEEGWGSGYNKLRNSHVIAMVSRDIFYKHRKLQPLSAVSVPTEFSS